MQRLHAWQGIGHGIEGLQQLTSAAAWRSGLDGQLAARGIAGFTDMYKIAREKAPLRRNTEAAEVGDTALFLFSALSRGITGQVLYVDNGVSILAF